MGEGCGDVDADKSNGFGGRGEVGGDWEKAVLPSGRQMAGV